MAVTPFLALRLAGPLQGTLGTPVRAFLEVMDDASSRLRDSLYTAVGFGVLGFQQAQLRRRELQRELQRELHRELARLAVEADEKVDPVLDDLEGRLPEELRPLVGQARSVARNVQRLLGRPPSGSV
jgi:hypothetical protein